jgi:hypothetical protein
MAAFTNRDNRLSRRGNTTKKQTEIKRAQLNLQQLRTATYNLTQLILHNNIDVAFVQELYIVLNKRQDFQNILEFLPTVMAERDQPLLSTTKKLTRSQLDRSQTRVLP